MREEHQTMCMPLSKAWLHKTLFGCLCLSALAAGIFDRSVPIAASFIALAALVMTCIHIGRVWRANGVYSFLASHRTDARAKSVGILMAPTAIFGFYTSSITLSALNAQVFSLESPGLLIAIASLAWAIYGYTKVSLAWPTTSTAKG